MDNNKTEWSQSNITERIALVLKPRLYPGSKCKFCGEKPNDNLRDLAEHISQHPKQVVKELKKLEALS